MPTDPTFTYPPIHHHTSVPLSPSSAAKPLAAYLEKSLTRPYLHPDAWLSLEGVRHGPKSGPQGSWAMHHLRRIEAGMRGEVLEVESMGDLVERFGEDVVGENTGVRGFGRREEEEVQQEEEVREGEFEEVRDVKEGKGKVVQVQKQKPEHEMTKAEKKKARRQAEKAQIQAARERGEEVPRFKKRKGENKDEDVDEGSAVNADINDPSQYESAEKYQREQETLLEDVGDRDPAGVDREDAVKAPVVVEHDKEGEVIVPPTETKKRKASAEETEAHRLAKKAKKAEQKAKKEAAGEDVEMADAVSAAPTTPAPGGAPLSKKERKKLRKSEAAAAEKQVNGGAETNHTPAAAEKAVAASTSTHTPAPTTTIPAQLSRKQKRKSLGGGEAHTPAATKEDAAQPNGTEKKIKKERKASDASAAMIPSSIKKEETNGGGPSSTIINGTPKLSKAERKKLKAERVKRESISS